MNTYKIPVDMYNTGILRLHDGVIGKLKNSPFYVVQDEANQD